MGILNRDGALYFATGIDNTGLYRGVAESKDLLSSLSGYAAKAGLALGGMFAVGTFTEFANKMVEVRGETEMLEKSFEVLLGNKEKSDKMLASIKSYAVESPLSLTGVSKAAQTLLSFNIEAEKVIPIIKQIGDVSMGNEDRFNSLTLAFAQMSSTGKLMGQDLLQMINAGFNPLTVISEKTGKSIGALKKEMEAGAISSDMVADAFRQATEQGGKFYGMTQKQAEGINGLKAQLEGGIQEAMNDLGKKSEGFTKDLYKGAISIVENYEKIGSAIMDIIVIYGSYKAALITINALHRLNMMVLREAVLVKKSYAAQSIIISTAEAVEQARTNILAIAKTRLIAVQKSLNAAIASNPYVIAAMAIAALVYGVYKLATAESAAEAAQRKHNEAVEKAAEKKENLISKTQQLVGKIKDETQTIYSQIKAWKELQKEMPETFGKMTMTEFKNMSDEDRGKLINKSAEKKDLDDFNKSFEDAQKKIETIKRAINEAYKTPNSGVAQSYFYKQLAEAEEMLRLKKAEKKEREEMARQAEFEAKPDKEKLSILNEQLQKYKDQYAELEKQVPETMRVADATGNIINSFTSVQDGIVKVNSQWGEFDWQTSMNIFQLNSLNNKINEIGGTIAGITSANGKGVSYSQAKSEAKKAYEDAQKAVNNIVKNGKDHTKKEYEDASDNLEKTKKAYQELGGVITTTKTSKTPKSKKEDLSTGIIQMQLKLEAERIAIMEDGKAKRLKLSEQEWKEQKEQIEKEQKERINKYKEQKKSMPEEEKKVYESRLKVNDEAKTKRDSDIEKDFNKEFETRAKEITTILLNEEQKRRASIKQRYDDERKWAAEALKSQSITQNQYTSFISNVNTAEQKEKLELTLNNLNDFKQREKELNEKWDAMITDAKERNDIMMIANLIKGKEKARNELNAQMLMESDDWKKLFGNLDELATGEIQKLIDLIKSKAKDLKLDPINFKAVIDGLKQAENHIRSTNPFASLIASIKKYKDAKGDEEKKLSFKDIAKDASASLGQVGSIFDSVTSGLKEMGLAGDEETQKLLGNISDMIGGAAELAKGIASGNPADIIAGSVKLITAAFNAFDSRSRKANREIKRHAEQLKILQDEYAKLEVAIKRALGQDYYAKQLELNENRKKQIIEIEAQIAAERSKKKKKQDNGKIDEWNNQIRQIKNDIEETKDNILSDLLTTDIKSFASTLANGITDGFSNGLSNLGSIVDKEIDNLMKKMIEKQFEVQIVQAKLKPMLDAATAATSDGMLTKDEIAYISKVGKDAKSGIIEGWEQWKQIMDEMGIKSDGVKEGVTGELQQQMTEGTGSQLVGLWNMTAMDLRAIKEWLMSGNLCATPSELRYILDATYQIEQNTRKTAENTNGIKEEFEEMNAKLEDIKNNTKTNNSRG